MNNDQLSKIKRKIPFKQQIKSILGLYGRGDFQNLELLYGRPRSIEYIYVSSVLSYKPSKILELGPVDSLYSIYLAQLGHEVWGIDIRDYKWKHPNFKFMKSDIRENKIPEMYFDYAIAISVFEHFCLAKDENGKIIKLQDQDEDLNAIKSLSQKVKKGGSIVLTFPYNNNGKLIESEMLRPYTKQKLEKLIDYSGCNIKDIRFFKVEKGTKMRIDRNKLLKAWEPCTQSELDDPKANYGTHKYGICVCYLVKED